MRSYSLDDFDNVPSAKQLVADHVDIDALPSMEQVRREAFWTTDMEELFGKDRTDVPDRSAAIQRMAYSGAENDWSDEQIAAALYDMDTRWGKYIERSASTRDNIILNMINRAREKHGYEPNNLDIDLSLFLKDSSVTVETGDQVEPVVWGFQDFVDAEFNVDWMFEGLLAQEGIGLITADPGTGKTQLSIQLGLYQALGNPRFLKWDNKVGKRKVLFLSLEMSKPPLHLFMSTIGQHYEDKLTLNQNFKVMPFGKPLPLDTGKGQAFLDNLLDEYMPDLLIIDSLQRSISKEMTDELAAKNLMHYLAVLRSKYHCAVVMIHHNRKKSSEAKKTDITMLSDVYGSVFFTADVDFVLSMNKKDGGKELSIHTLKNRLGVEHAPCEVERDENEHFDIFDESMWHGDGEEKTGLDV